VFKGMYTFSHYYHVDHILSFYGLFSKLSIFSSFLGLKHFSNRLSVLPKKDKTKQNKNHYLSLQNKKKQKALNESAI